MDSTKKYSGPSEICCLCRRRVPSYNNPDPLMDGTEDCCDECNQLVKAARVKIFYMEESKRNAYEQKLRTLSYEELKKELQ